MFSLNRPRLRAHRCRRVHLLAAALIFFLILMLYVILKPGYVIDNSYPTDVASNKGFEVFFVEKICSDEETEFCCSVVDVIDEKRSFEAKRLMYFGAFQDNFESEICLVPYRSGVSVENSDTRLWKVDHLCLLNNYVAAMIVLPFAIGALNHNVITHQSMLSIGLGGGSLDMFLREKTKMINITVIEKEPMVKILAEKWFGVIDDNNRRTVLMDGAEAVLQAVNHNETYDVIIVDACDSRVQTMPCPAPLFLSESFLINSKKILKPLGALVINVLPLIDENENLKKVRRKLLKFFPTCLSLKMVSQMNNVLACMGYLIQPENVHDTITLWELQLEKMANEFGLEGILKGSSLKFEET